VGGGAGPAGAGPAESGGGGEADLGGGLAGRPLGGEAVRPEDELLGARAGEAAALERAEQTEQRQAAAEQARAAAAAPASAAEARAVAAETASAQLREQLAASERNSRDLETGRVRAEAEADSLRLVLADLGQDLRATLRGQRGLSRLVSRRASP
jgi:hypothetical protein